jgi:hypothetical protein
MIRIITTVMFLSLILCSDLKAADAGVPSQNLNAEQIGNTGRAYFLAIRFSSINAVSIYTSISAQSLGYEKKKDVLSPDEWKYDSLTGVLTIERDVDNKVSIVRAEGEFQTPMCILLQNSTDPSKIRAAVNGKICVAGTDYFYDENSREIKLAACPSGNENYFLQFPSGDGAVSIGSMGAGDFTLTLRKYFELSLEGNMISPDGSGVKFIPSEAVHYKSVWGVQLFPLRDGYGGKDLLSGFSWSTEKNELVLDECVDLTKYSVYMYGEE